MSFKKTTLRKIGWKLLKEYGDQWADAKLLEKAEHPQWVESSVQRWMSMLRHAQQQYLRIHPNAEYWVVDPEHQNEVGKKQRVKKGLEDGRRRGRDGKITRRRGVGPRLGAKAWDRPDIWRRAKSTVDFLGNWSNSELW